MRNDDDAAAKKAIEKSLKSWFADGATVNLVEVKNLRAAESPLVISATVELPSAASLVGSRAMVPLAIFAATHKNPFSSEQRKSAIYFHYGYRVNDEVTLKVPAGYAVESLPKTADVDLGALHYTATVGKTDDGVRLVRNVTVDAEIIGRDKYPDHARLFQQGRGSRSGAGRSSQGGGDGRRHQLKRSILSPRCSSASQFPASPAARPIG